VSAGAPAHKRLTLVACILGSGIVFLDGTVVNVALPAIASDLEAGLAAQQWVVEAFLLALGALLLVGGSLGDLAGRRRIFTAGLAGFGAASLLCAVAPTVEALVAGRALQGIAGALLVPSTLALLMDTFDEGERGAAIGTWTAYTGVAVAVGPFVGGLLVDTASWRWIFAINVPLVAVTLWLVARYVRADVPQPRAPVDVAGGTLAALGLAGPVLALIEQPHRGWADPLVLGSLGGGALFLAAFVWRERRARAPMLPLALFASRNFSVGNVSTLLLYGALGAAFFFLVIFLQQVAGYSAVAAGLSLVPVTVVMLVLSRRLGALADRTGPRLFMGVGPIVAGAGLLLLMGMDAEASYPADVLPGVAVFGLGLAITVAPLTAAVLAAVEARHSGLASGINNAASRVAGLLAIAAVGAVLAGVFASGVDARAGDLSPEARTALAQGRDEPLRVGAADGAPEDERAAVRAVLTEASVDAFRTAMGVCGGLSVAAGLLSLGGIRNPRREVPARECPGGALVGASTDAANAATPGSMAPRPLPART
jgi:EmrB/QacA subfamily drug resistance transporter